MEERPRDKYLAISESGQTILGASLLEVAEKARDTFGPGRYLYKVGEKAVGRWR